jgi:hypothetical protein
MSTLLQDHVELTELLILAVPLLSLLLMAVVG